MLGVATIALRAAGCTWPKPSATPISRWEFDETSSAEGVFEDRGPAHVLMLHAGTWADLTTDPLVAGDDGTSAYTDGSAYATIPADVPAYNLAAITISFYYQRESASDKHILLAGGNGSQVGDFSIEVLPNGRLRGWHTGQDNQLRFFESTNGVTGTDLQVGTAHRIELTLGAQGARLYLDGAELAAAAIPANTNGWNNSRVKFLGRWTDGAQAPAIGVFDRLRIWNRQLTGAEIAELEAAQSITLPGPPDEAVELPEPLTAFGHTRVRVTILAGWPAGRIPREVVGQGSLAHAYVRRAWKPGENDGTWMDFQAGWRNGTGDSVAVRLDDGSLININFDVQRAIPSPGPGGTTRVLDKLGGGNFTTWTAAIAALNNNDVLVVRARAGGEVYTFDANTGGATSTANGVTVMAHPDDLAAGRRPRIHVWGSRFARYADDLNESHWVEDTDLGSPHGKVWKSAATFSNPGNVGCSYRTKGGGLKRCYTYTNTPGTPGALARLRDKTYPRVPATPDNSDPSGWALYHGPGIYWHSSDQRLYIRLSALRDGVGAIQVNKNAGVGTNPPWDWSDDDPENENPNLCELFISATGNQADYNPRPTTGINYILRIHNRSGWTIENLDFVSGGNGIEMYNTTNTTLRGCRFLGWAPPNLSMDTVGQSTAARVYNCLDAQTASNVLCDRCEFWGGQAPWYGWDENKGRHGAFSWAHKSNLFFMDSGSDAYPQIGIRFTNCLMDGFPLFTRQNGYPQYMKFHQCKLHYCGMDGLLACRPPSEVLEFLRCQLFEAAYNGWVNGDPNGTTHLGYCLITNFRPFCHQNGYWNTNVASNNDFLCCKPAITHGNQARETQRHRVYNNTGIGGHNHMRNVLTKSGGAGVTRDGAGACLTPWRGTPFSLEWMGRNNILAVRPNGSLGDNGGQTGGAFGDSHCACVLHANHMGFDVGGSNYSCDYNLYHRHAGMPTLAGANGNGVITTVNAGGTETARNSITDVRSDTGQEQNGRIADPQFVGSWNHTKRDSELHANAFWCLQPGSPAASGGDTTNRLWADVDFGTEITYGGNSWLGCMDPGGSAVEQQVGPLGPLPSGI